MSRSAVILGVELLYDRLRSGSEDRTAATRGLVKWQQWAVLVSTSVSFTRQISALPHDRKEPAGDQEKISLRALAEISSPQSREKRRYTAATIFVVRARNSEFDGYGDQVANEADSGPAKFNNRF